MAEEYKDYTRGPNKPASRDRPTSSERIRVEREPDTIREEHSYMPRMASAIRRISWGAIIAGAVVALVIQLMLNLLGLSIGLGAIDPATETNPLSGISTGAGIWFIVTSLIALFIGGWTAGRFAGLPRRLDGLLHGFVAWAVTTFVTLYLVGSGVGTVLGTAFNVVQEGAQFLGQGISAVAPGVGQAISSQVDGQISLDQLRTEVSEILRQTGQEELQPENLAERARQAAGTAGEAATDAAQTPADAQQDIQNALDQLIAQGRNVISEVDRQAAVNVLVARTDMTEAEAQQTVRQYEDAIQQARTQVSQTVSNVGQQATETADSVIATMSSAALWGFLAMVFGAAAAAGGGAAGSPHDMPASEAVRRE